jgi:cell division protease FtsH
MAATNRPEILDPALLRAGRFDRHVLVDRPDKTGRFQILNIHLRKVKTVKNLDVERIAEMTPGMVGADLANLVNEAALLAVRRNKKEVSMQEFEEAVEKVVAGLEKKNRVMNPKEREIVAHHEIGHALVAMSLPGTDPVRKISIIPRGIAALGYTMQVPTEDRYLLSKTELLNRIATLLGGRAAEEITFGDISTGAQNDLSRATDMAKSMVKEYGMSEKAGQVYFAHDKRPEFLGYGMSESPDYSEATSELIDSEISQIISTQHRRALEILNKQKEILIKGASLLLKNEKIQGDELKALVQERRADQAEAQGNGTATGVASKAV